MNDAIFDVKWDIGDFPMAYWEEHYMQYKGNFVYNWFSNFEHSPIEVNGVKAQTVEHYYQSQKTLNLQEQDLVLTCPTPGQAKRAGRHITLRPDWETVKFGVMYQALLAKCFAHPEFLSKLRSCGEIIEWNNWGDQTWGATLGGRGRNALGVMLMFLRDNL